MRKRTLVLIIFMLLLVVACASLFIGPVRVPLEDFSSSPIIMDIRLPRILLSAIVGMLLATSGVILQGILRNPLADPYILGVSAGAGVGAAAAITLGFSFIFLGMSPIQLLAFIFALIAVLIVYRLSQVSERTSPETLILAGVAVSAFASAVLALLIILSGQLQSIYFWLLGSFSSATWNDIYALLPYLVVGVIIAYYWSKDLNALLLGDEMAQSLGVEVDRLRLFMIITATLMTAAAVSVSGLIGFVGLIVPHFVRLISGPNHRLLVPFSALGGAVLMVLADTIARTALSPSEIPVGVVMALLGAPFFLYLLRRRRLYKR